MQQNTAVPRSSMERPEVGPEGPEVAPEGPRSVAVKVGLVTVRGGYHCITAAGEVAVGAFSVAAQATMGIGRGGFYAAAQFSVGIAHVMSWVFAASIQLASFSLSKGLFGAISLTFDGTCYTVKAIAWGLQFTREKTDLWSRLSNLVGSMVKGIRDVTWTLSGVLLR